MASSFWNDLYNSKYLLAIGSLAGVASAAILIGRLKRSKVGLYNDPPDTVILCQLSRGPAVPSMSPFSLKLETYLRIANIPYKSVGNRGVSPKGKTPYIMYNGEVISDSQFCIEYLNKKYNVDLDKDLTPEQKAVSRGLRKLTEDSLYWCAILERYNYAFNKDYLMMAFENKFTSLTLYLMRRYYNQIGHSQGTGRHSRIEVLKIANGDLQALSDYLGKKQYFMGNKVTEVDCAIFGLLCQFKWQFPGSPIEKMVTEKYPNLDEFILRMREEFWEDWADYIHHGGYRPAKK